MLRSRLTLAMTVGALSVGCASAPSALMPGVPQLVLERTETTPHQAALSQPERLSADSARPDVAPVTPRAGGSGSSSSSGVALIAGHRLRVDLRSFLASLQPAAQRRVLATVADIDRLVLTVQQPGQPDQVATLTQAQIASGVAEMTFDGLPVGNAIVFVVAYDASGAPIGSAAQVVVISEATSAIADMTVQLVPETAPSGPGGTLVTKTTFINGAPPSPPPSGTVLGEFEVMGWPRQLVAGPGGSMFVGCMFYDQNAFLQTGNTGYAMSTTVARLTADGTSLFWGMWPMAAFDQMAYAPATNRIWLSNPGRVVESDGTATMLGLRASAIATNPAGEAYYVDTYQTGQPIAKAVPGGTGTATGMHGFSAMAFDADGHLWTNWYDTSGGDVAASVRKYAPDGSLLGTFSVSGAVHGLIVAPTGDIWLRHGTVDPTQVTDYIGHQETQSVSRLSPDGTVLGTYAQPARDAACDASGNLWLAGSTMRKIALDGTLIKAIPFDAYAIAVDDTGYIWAGAEIHLVKKFQP